ncbi:MAG: galactokinase [Clostridia bacterium]|nr:galactokinase [Clostridia bacterium]
MLNVNRYERTLGELYGERAAQRKAAFESLAAEFEDRYGGQTQADRALFSVPGRTEVSGNHTDHNRGKVLCASVDVDVIAVAAPTKDHTVRVKSRGFDEDVIDLHDLSPIESEKFTSVALIRGVAAGMLKRGYRIDGFCACTDSDVPKGSGLSSSAAFENMIGTVFSGLFNGSGVDMLTLAQISQEAEINYFGKPCGLMDQIACAAGGFAMIDFEDQQSPVIEKIDFSPAGHGYDLFIVSTGGSHASLNAEYAAIPSEMRTVAAFFGKTFMREVEERQVIENAADLRTMASDRAVLRAIHFLRENDRVTKQAEALKRGDMKTFLTLARESGLSSARFLQNSYANADEQGIPLATAVAEGFPGVVCRVHGGGFAGTVQAFVPHKSSGAFVEAMKKVFGDGSVTKLFIRAAGAVKLEEDR